MQLSRFRRSIALTTCAALLGSLTVATVAAPAAAGNPTCRGVVATIVGTPGADVIVGTTGRDVIAALAGDDIVRGRGGNDLICGGLGDDRIVGSRGLDRIYGNAGSDRLFGGAGPDRLFGGMGDDLLAGRAGNDRLDGGPGTDSCYQHQGTGPEIDCERPVVNPAILAIAYGDLNGNHTFDDGDVLISKLVDTSGDRRPSAGDTIIMGKYPKERDPSATDFSDWGVKRHHVTDAAGIGSDRVTVSAGAAEFRYIRKSATSADSYIELDADGLTYVRDENDDVGIPALVLIDPLSPSRPSDTIDDELGGGDDELIDVELDY